MLDTILRNGTIIDGSGDAPRRADLGMSGGRIEVVGNLAGVRCRDDLDVAGMVVAPGFVDVHTHSDLASFLPAENEPVKLAAVRQGVTSEVIGNCGWTPFPAAPGSHEQIREHVASVFGPAARAFGSLAEYRAAMSEQPLPNNLAPLVGHGTIRAAVLGLDRTTADATAVRDMRRLLRQALDEGAFGMSTGLVYPPGVYSDSRELVALCEVLREHSRIYTTHMRNEMELVLEATEEALDVARRTGATVQLSHLKVAGRERWGTVDRLVERIERAKRQGFDVAGDAYPYTAGSTLLRAVLPPWVNEGGVTRMLERLGDPETRRSIGRQYESGIPGWQNFVGAAGWDGIVVASAPGRPDTEGRSIAELAADRGVSGPEMAADLILELRGEVVVVLHMMDEADVRTLIGEQDVLIGSDTIPLPGSPHPRSAGTFVRVLGRYVREQSVSGLSAMIRRVTAVPVARFGLGRRGQLRSSYAADVVVFDADVVRDRATYADPLRPPNGVRHVFVDGVAVVRGGDDTGMRPGRLLEPVD